jgi:hypothetical protein
MLGDSTSSGSNSFFFSFFIQQKFCPKTFIGNNCGSIIVYVVYQIPSENKHQDFLLFD